MGKTIIYQSRAGRFVYFLLDLFTEEPEEVTEDEFWDVVGMNRTIVPMEYAPDNINRQNFLLDGRIIGYREHVE